MMRGGYEFQGEFARSYVAKGEIKAKAHAVLAVLEARGLEVPVEVRERVVASTDLAELDCWLRRAVVVRAAREILAATGS
ncbi:hypothetical protein [Sorangium sp. So ce388]|uniref:hypothetical protein n=1 Tax=Sorangium sp. So ce388 TaxID=3133309 RepID=UPI003F5AEAC7